MAVDYQTINNKLFKEKCMNIHHRRGQKNVS